MDLNGASALVTGGATGIGAAAVMALAKAGYDVAINYGSSEAAARKLAAEVEQLGRKALLVKCDVSDEAGVRAMMKKIDEAFGHLDALVNNAGTPGTRTTIKPNELDRLTEDLWDTVLQVNLLGVFRCSKAAAPALKAAKGAIVSIASIAGINTAGSSMAYARPRRA